MKKIGIIVAMEEELDDILHILKYEQKKVVRGIDFIEGKINNKDCIIALAGVGKVNAARTTQVMISEFDLEYVINLGVAGGVNPGLEIGDVIIAKNSIQHDFDITAFGHSKGYISGIGNGIISDRNLLYEMEQVIKSSPEREYKIKFGVVATGDIFCTETWMKDKICVKFKADVVDMECGAIAQVCYLEKMPFIAIRGVSDIPNGRNLNTYKENLQLASKRCANLLKEFLN